MYHEKYIPDFFFAGMKKTAEHQKKYFKKKEREKKMRKGEGKRGRDPR